MTKTEHEVFEELFESCRSLLRYDGINKDHVRQDIDNIREIVDEYLDMKERE